MTPIAIWNTSTTGKTSERAEEVKLTILEAVVKGYHECSFAVRIGDKFVVKQKRGDRGPAPGSGTYGVTPSDIKTVYILY